MCISKEKKCYDFPFSVLAVPVDLHPAEGKTFETPQGSSSALHPQIHVGYLFALSSWHACNVRVKINFYFQKCLLKKLTLDLLRWSGLFCLSCLP